MMADFFDDFDGPADQLISARPGYTAIGPYEWGYTNGSGSVKIGATNSSGGTQPQAASVVRNLGVLNMWSRVVIGQAAIISSNVLLCGVKQDTSGTVGYAGFFARYQDNYKGFYLGMGDSNYGGVTRTLLAGDSAEIQAKMAADGLSVDLTLLHNGVPAYGPINTTSVQRLATGAGIRPSLPAPADDYLRSFACGELLDPPPGISIVGCQVGSTTATIPAHQAGDLILVFSYRDGNTTPPTLVSGFTNIHSSGTASNSSRLAYKLAASSSEVTGTWANATSTIVVIYRGVDQSNPIGGASITGGTSTTINFPSLTMQVTDGSSWVAGFVGHRSTDTAINTAPAGMMYRYSVTDGTDQAAFHDSNGGVTSWSSSNASIGGTSSGYSSVTVEIRAAAPATLSSPEVSDVSSTSGDPKVTTNKAGGTLYAVVVADGDTPSVAQIKAGQDSTGASAIAARSQSVTTAGQQTMATVTGLTTGTAYDVWFVHTNDVGDSAAVKADFTPSLYPAYTPTWKTAGTATGWTNSGNASASDNSYAVGTSTGWMIEGPILRLSNFNFSLPAGVVLKEVRYRIEGYYTTSSGITASYDPSPFHWAANASGAPAAGAVGSTVLLGSTEAVYEGVWPASQFSALSLSDFNSANFGITWKTPGTTENAFSGGTVTLYVDRIELMWVDTGPPPVFTNDKATLFWAFP